MQNKHKLTHSKTLISKQGKTRIKQKQTKAIQVQQARGQRDAIPGHQMQTIEILKQARANQHKQRRAIQNTAHLMREETNKAN